MIDLIKKYGIYLMLVGFLVSFKIEKAVVKYPYKNAALPVNMRVADLISRMTPDEKIKQLDMFMGSEVTDMKGRHEATTYSEEKTAQVLGKTGIGSIHDFYPITPELANQIQKYALEKTRLGIPVLFIEEGLHGYIGYGSTEFPVPLQLSSAWDTTLVRQVGHVIGEESRAHGIEMILAPVLGLARDPRWGRVEETYGEDPYLNSVNGVAMVKGMQGKSLSSHDAIIAEPKHFAVHSVPEAGSNMATVNMGEREVRSEYLYVFEKAVREAHAMGIMAAYSELDGIPCVDNKWLLTDVLRKEWGFKGFVLSDLGAIKMSLKNHGVAADTSDALAQTFNAGMNMQFYDFSHKGFVDAMTKAIKDKSLSMAQLNKAVSDVLRVKFMLGLFDNPYIDPAALSTSNHTQTNQDLALKAAQESITLLKNDNGVLPLKKDKKVAVIGLLAESGYLGDYSNEQTTGISILDGLKQRAGNTMQISYEPGYSSRNVPNDLQDKAVQLVQKSDVAVVVLGEDVKVDGEGKDRSGLDLDEHQLNLIKAIQQTGKPVAVVLFNGRPLSINWIAQNVPSILETWYSGEKGGLAVADVLLGNINPSGKLPITFPRSIGQVPFYYDHKPMSNHHYVDQRNTPLFPFGFGLSYTTFTYSDLKIETPKIPVNGAVKMSVKITNSGTVEGTEVVEAYIRDLVSSVTTPVLELKGFKRVSLQPGESNIVNFTISANELAVWNREMKKVVEPGEFNVMIGSSSRDIKLRGSFGVTANVKKK